MKFTTNEDVAASIDATFDMLCDFETFERAAMRRGAEVQRVDRKTDIGTGMTWDAVFELRGKRREVQVELVTYDRPEELVFASTSPGLLGEMRFELIALAKERTRIKVELELKPLTLTSRLFVQSLRLGKKNLTKRYKQRVADYAKTMEERYRRIA